jgi:hypothetical protein
MQEEEAKIKCTPHLSCMQEQLHNMETKASYSSAQVAHNSWTLEGNVPWLIKYLYTHQVT